MNAHSEEGFSLSILHYPFPLSSRLFPYKDASTLSNASLTYTFFALTPSQLCQELPVLTVLLLCFNPLHQKFLKVTRTTVRLSNCSINSPCIDALVHDWLSLRSSSGRRLASRILHPVIFPVSLAAPSQSSAFSSSSLSAPWPSPSYSLVSVFMAHLLSLCSQLPDVSPLSFTPKHSAHISILGETLLD